MHSLHVSPQVLLVNSAEVAIFTLDLSHFSLLLEKLSWVFFSWLNFFLLLNSCLICRAFIQINLLLGMQKLTWTKKGKESISAASFDKGKLVSLLMSASGQVSDLVEIST